jgi:predicted porin
MKKTLIALAAVAATSAAFAQSSVTVYGKVDIGISNAIGGATKAQTGLNEAAGSRLGFRGTEDLGGGLKANFTLEHRFKPDTGMESNPGTFWQGRSIVGLSGGFGRVDMGRDYTAAFWPALAADVFGFDGVAQNTPAIAAGTHSVRMANVINYTSPNLGGVTLRGSYAMKESANANADDGVSFAVNYTTGGLSLDAAVERSLLAAAGGATETSDWTGLGASYNFGVAKASILVTKGDRAAQPTAATPVVKADTDGMILGLVVPMGALTLKASYATLEVNNTKTISQLGLGARYALSKRTDVYGSYARNSKATVDKTGFEIGLQHNF